MATIDVNSPVFIDTNVLVRATLVTAPQHADALVAMERLWSEGMSIWISRQVLREYAAVLTRPQTYAFPISPAAVAAQLRVFLTQFHVADENAQVTTNLMILLETTSLGGKQVHDANIVATMQAYGIGQLLTHNVKDFVRFSGLVNVLSFSDVVQR
ncbi:MAG: type II toxin-antitoxin system VapC family toxin [Anaerolineae bacterium]|nr:type II toxin-antitoxin system VapC family toxin [Anaerolineae bacterium]